MKYKQQLKKLILEKELQIKKLYLKSSSSDICNQLCNTLILQKAILKRDLDDIDKNPVVDFFKQVLPKKEKLICDYFKG